MNEAPGAPRPNNRAHPFGFGMAFVLVLAVGLLLLSGYSPHKLINSYKNQIRELRLENDSLLYTLEMSMEETDSLREETLRLNEELLRLELALWKANEAANGPVDTKTASNIINAPVDSMPKDEQDTDSIQSASTSVETGPEDYPVEQRSHKTIVDQSTDNTYDLLGRSGELEIEVQYEDASPADQRAYDKYINELGYHVSYKEFRFSNKYKLTDTN